MSLTKVSNQVIQTPYRKNFIINGDGRVWQRGQGVSVAAGNSYYQADRFLVVNGSDGVVTYGASQSVPDTRFIDTFLVDVTTADASIAAGQYLFMTTLLEGYDYRFLVGQQAVLSFYVRSNKTGIYSVAFCTGSPSIDRGYIVEYTIDSADTWEYKTIPITFNGDNSANFTNLCGVAIRWCLAAGSTFKGTPGSWLTGNYIGSSNNVNFLDSTSNEWRMVGAQLELGTVATPLEFRPVGEEIALCQRYYEAGSIAITLGATTMYVYEHFAVSKRPISPSNPIEIWSTSGAAGYIRYLNSATDILAAGCSGNSNGFLYGQAGLTDGGSYQFNWVCNAEIV